MANIYYGSNPNIEIPTTSITSNVQLKAIFDKLGISYGSSPSSASVTQFTVGDDGASISQGVFCMNIITNDSTSIYITAKGTGTLNLPLKYLHYVPYGYTSMPNTFYYRSEQNPTTHPENATTFLVNRQYFNTAIQDNVNLFTTFIIKKCYSQYNSDFYPIITCEGYTNNRTVDMWYETPHSFPLIGGWPSSPKPLDEGTGSIHIPSITQTSFNVKAICTNSDKIGEVGWGRKMNTFIEKANTFGINSPDSSDTADNTTTTLCADDYCDGIDANANISQLLGKKKQPTASPLFITELVAASASGVFAYKSMGITDSDSDYLNGFPVYSNSTSTFGCFTNNKIFTMYNTTGGANGGIRGVPVLFTFISDSKKIYDEWSSNTVSLSCMSGICTCFAKVLSTTYNKPEYNDFDIYYTTTTTNFDTINISYAIDLRPLTNGESVIDGKVTISDYNNSDAVLAIANKNIYILSSSQLQYISRPDLI